jgi:hypothetical protein
MTKRKRKASAALLVRADVLERMLALLKDLDQKIEYLIKNLRRFNSNHNHLNHTLPEFMD